MPARRPGKLPPETIGATYLLEYGENVLEVHPDLIPAGVARRDPRRRARDRRHRGGDLRARGALGGVVVGACFIIELTFLGGRERLDGLDVHSLIDY